MSQSPKFKEFRAQSSSPIKSRTIQLRTICPIESCPVSDKSLGIISENDHRVGLCICKFCECGQHSCPNPMVKDYYPQSTFSTNYKNSFKASGFSPVLKHTPKFYQPNGLKMDLITTNQADYKPFSVSPQKQKGFNWPTTTGIKSPTNSVYNSEYINWGPTYVQIQKRFQPPVRSVEIPFRGQSSYRNQYYGAEATNPELYRVNLADLGATGSNFALGPKDCAQFLTTYGENMKDYSASGLNKVIKVEKKPVEEIPVLPNHFQTTTKSFYQNSETKTKDPRRFRVELNSRFNR